uniref:Hydrolase (HAD superfamily) n=1 Tax=Sphingomonas sp. NS2 TaxID=908605 RepID=A0A0D4ZYC5_9SPHN|nr:Hydrolase (HAD superfamily) [Sphingomonas sp. NS2]
MPDLGVQLLDFRLTGSLRAPIAVIEQAGHPIHRLPLPCTDHRVVDAMLRCQFRQRQIATDRLHRNLRLEIRAVALSRRLHSRPFLQVGMSLAPCSNFRHHLTLFDRDGTIRFAHRLDGAVAATILRLIDRPGVAPWVYADGAWFVTRLDNPHLARERLAAGIAPVIRTDFAGLDGRVDKIVGVSDDHDLLRELEERAKAMVGEQAAVVRSQPYYLDVTHNLANKGDGITALARAFGVELAQVAALGDMPNDVPMFARVGFAVAMGQAPASVRTAASATAASNEEDGVADAVHRFVRPRIARS